MDRDMMYHGIIINEVRQGPITTSSPSKGLVLEGGEG